MSVDHAALAPKIAELAERAAAAILDVYESDFFLEFAIRTLLEGFVAI